MSNLFKKALGAFVEFDEKEQQAPRHHNEEAAPAAAPVLPDAPADLDQDPDVQRVSQAISLLSSLPLADIPADKARELIVRTLQFAGMKPEELTDSFVRAQTLYQSAIGGEQAAIAARQQQNLERLKLLEQAIAEEKDQCAGEVTARNERINQATSALVEIEKAMAFFTTKETGQAN
ncbi:MAG TPA: hypothetical protein VGK74_26235 [Symbiobacteriaceae bacterium]|jgi:hypothetical protein